MNLPSGPNDNAQLMLDTSLELICTEATSFIVNSIRETLESYPAYNLTILGRQVIHANVRRILEFALSYAHRMMNVKINGKDCNVIPARSFGMDAESVMAEIDITTLLFPNASEPTQTGWRFFGKTMEEIEELVKRILEQAIREGIWPRIHNQQQAIKPSAQPPVPPAAVSLQELLFEMDAMVAPALSSQYSALTKVQHNLERMTING